MNMVKNLTEGRPLNLLFFFALPMVAGNLFQQLYNMVDTAVVGKFVGEDAVAAVGSSFPIVFLSVAVASGLSMGCTVVVSQLFGAGRIHEMKTTISTAIISLSVLGLIIMALGTVFAGPLLQLLGTDPDCDRCGTAVPDGKGGYRLITGNEMGIILLDYICRTRKALGTMPEHPVAVTTIVSTDMATPVAAKYGVELRRTLTGFKFIGEQIGKLEAEGHVERYIFGFEESYGYLSGGHVRDKDAVNATLLVCEAAAWYAQQGMTLLDAIEALYKEFGYYRNALCSFAFEGETGMYTMQNLMKTLRADPPKEILDVTLSESAANRHHGKAFTWGGLWKTRTLWGVLLIRFVSDPVWYFCLFWLPGYLQEDSGLTLIQVGWVGWIPFLFGAVGGVLTSAWSDKMVRKGMDPLRARKRMMTLVAVAAPLCIFTPYFNALPPYWNVAAIIASFSLIAIMCLSWLYTICVVIAEAFPVRNVASVVGITAGFGAVGGAIFNYYVGQLLSTMGPSLFLVMGVLHWIAVVILWKMTRPEIPQEKQAVQK